MELSNGVDILKISRVEKSIQRERFLTHVYGPRELQQYEEKGKKVSFLAGNFAAKEAFAKALGTGVRNFSLAEVEVLRNSLGQPFFSLSGKAKKIVEDQCLKFTVSISHEKDYVIAFVTAWSEMH